MKQQKPQQQQQVQVNKPVPPLPPQPPTAPASALTAEAAPRAKFRAGMVGAGNICEFHVAAVKALPDVELVGVYDLDRERARAAAERWGTRAFDSFEELVAAGANV
ncbi:MAG: Gfo/Idh/MocA family oxidoreductase, partial [Deltaproteobacteria bacterium]|nr:Gfo/Idh/MocA family oxidoreductase [Deltaproteobacteria bacterium]